jgi:hypothetical protein
MCYVPTVLLIHRYDEGMFSIVNYVGSALMLAGVLLPLVHEESRSGGGLGMGLELPLHNNGVSEHHEYPLGHYNNTVHFVHHDSSEQREREAQVPKSGSGSSSGSGGTAKMRRRPAQGEAAADSATDPELQHLIQYEDDL